MKRVLVIGATGFLGRHLVPALNKTGKWEVVGAAKSALHPLWVRESHYRSIDIGSQRDALDLIYRASPTAIVQLAGTTQGSTSDLCRTNIVGTANILAAALRYAPNCRMILIGSAAEYGPVRTAAMPITEDTACAPEAAYGVTKLAATELAMDAARSWGARVTIVRPFNMVGAYMPSHLIGGALVERIHAVAAESTPQPIRLGRTDTQRDFVAVQDVVGALIRLLDIDECGEIYNLCSGTPTPIMTLLQMLIELSGRDLHWETDPALIRADDVLTSYGSHEKASRRLHFEPTVALIDALRTAWQATTRTPER